jgi:phosphatidate phosphatase APP1
MLKSLLLISFVLGSSAALAREIVIVSDMDETTRIANIEKKVKAGAKLLVGVKPYEGLRAIYNEMAKNPEVKFYYLSNSYPFLYDGVKWKKENGFPKGVVMQRSLKDKSDSFKPAKLKEIASAHPDASFILVGDNVEHDPKFYRDFVASNPQLDTKVYIRDARLIFPQEQSITYFQTEAQITDDLGISEETATQIRTLAFHKLVPKFLLKNLRSRLVKACKASVTSCREAADARVLQVIDEINPNPEVSPKVELTWDENEEEANLE